MTERETFLQAGAEVVAEGLAWPESPRWHADALWFSDVHQFRVMRVTAGRTPELVAQAPGRPAGMGFMPDGRLLLATALDKCLWWVGAKGALTLAADLGPLVRGVLNDMVVDAAGRAWIGDTGFDLLKGEPERPGSLLCWQEGSVPRVAAQDVRFPNGIAITPDGRALYLAETFGSCISAWNLAPDGTLSGRRVHVELGGRPDGLCLDADGALWVALLWDGRFQRIDGRGRIGDEIVLHGERAISCVLAGDGRRELYLGVARVDDSNKQDIRRQGRLLRVRSQVPGAGSP